MAAPSKSRDAAATLDEAIAAAAPELLDLINGSFSDSLLFVARILGRADGAEAAEAVAIDQRGVDLRVIGVNGPRHVRVDFVAPVDDADHVGDELFALVTHARDLSGESGATSAERELAKLSATRTFVTSVAKVETVHPHLRRITLGGGDLVTFNPLGPDTFLFVLLPPAGHRELTVGQDFTWERAAAMPAAEQPVGAYYTVSAWRPELTELELLMVLHDPAGPASEWAARAQPGDPVALWGPREAFEPPDDTLWFLLVADDTGLPAVAAILEALPPGTPALVVAEVRDETERQALPAGDGIDVTWVHRGDAEPGTVPERTLDAVRALRLPDGPGYVWGGGESRVMTAVRKYVRHELDLPRHRVSLIGYWRHVASPAHDDET